MKNSVTVVIPTRNRPQLVLRAVMSALSQTFTVEEVIVVVDGPDDSTVTALREVGDPRLRTVVLPSSGGSNNARNQGAAQAKTQWVAFLDDDDEWLPEKIEVQLRWADRSDILSCRFFAQSSTNTMIWPKRLPGAQEKFGDYLFGRRSVFNGEAAIITSTLMVRRELFNQLPFSTLLRRHQDADWVIRSTESGSRFVYVPDALVKFNDDIGRVRISTSYNWRESLDWIQTMRKFLGPRAYAGFVLTSVGSAASDKRDWVAFGLLLREAIKRGRPTVLHLLLYLGMWVFPQRTRQQARSLLNSRRQQEAFLILRQENRA